MLFWRGLLKLSAGMEYKLQTVKTEFRFQKIDNKKYRTIDCCNFDIKRGSIEMELK